jgi:hypothetical protein
MLQLVLLLLLLLRGAGADIEPPPKMHCSTSFPHPMLPMLLPSPCRGRPDTPCPSRRRARGRCLVKTPRDPGRPKQGLRRNTIDMGGRLRYSNASPAAVIRCSRNYGTLGDCCTAAAVPRATPHTGAPQRRYHIRRHPGKPADVHPRCTPGTPGHFPWVGGDGGGMGRCPKMTAPRYDPNGRRTGRLLVPKYSSPVANNPL